jgi:hypothetical protein
MLNNITGWVTPKGQFVDCLPYQHIEAFKKNPIFQKYEKIQIIFSNLETIEKDCENLMACGEHPEWHCYESALDSASYKIRNILYKEGFVRVGTLQKNYWYNKEEQDELHFEGKPFAIKKLHDRCLKLAKENNMLSVFEPIKG